MLGGFFFADPDKLALFLVVTCVDISIYFSGADNFGFGVVRQGFRSVSHSVNYFLNIALKHWLCWVLRILVICRMQNFPAGFDHCLCPSCEKMVNGTCVPIRPACG